MLRRFSRAPSIDAAVGDGVPYTARRPAVTTAAVLPLAAARWLTRAGPMHAYRHEAAARAAHDAGKAIAVAI